MARPGRPRKNPEDLAPSAYARKKEAEAIVLPPWDGKTRGPTLGRYNPEGKEWHKLTLKWWKTYRQSSQAMFMTDTDWESLFVGAVMHDRIMRGVADTALANLVNSLGRRESAVGASIEDRVRLNMVPDRPNEDAVEAAVQADAAKIIDYATRLNKRVGGGYLGSP